jgi:uncharacterized protein
MLYLHRRTPLRDVLSVLDAGPRATMSTTPKLRTVRRAAKACGCGSWICRGLAVFSTAILLLSGGCATGRIRSDSPQATPDLIVIPDVRQSTDFSCGATALQALLAYYSEDWSEEELIKLLGTNQEIGTTPESLVRVATALGLRASIGENLTFDDLRAALDERIPVIVAFQAWVDVKPPEFSWAECWEEGHYAVVIGMDADYVYLEDPSLFGTRGRIPVREFGERWHDYSGVSPMDAQDRRWVHLGIIIREGGAKGGKLPMFTDVE